MKIKIKDIPKVCPMCGGLLAECGSKESVSLLCIDCQWEKEYELHPPCSRCKYYTCRFKEVLVYEDDSIIKLPTNERCILRDEPTRWDNYCERWEEIE